MNKLKLANNYVKNNSVKQEELPLFHVAPKIGWMNDPNGFSMFNDEIHLFYQYHPYSNVWGPMHWGHVKSKDMIMWENLPVALSCDESYDEAGCFSGSAIVKDGKHYLVYTGVKKIMEDGKLVDRQTQCVAIGDGINYQKYESNPVITSDMLIENSNKEHFRDPKVWFEDGKYWMVTGNKTVDGMPLILLYSSDDLFKWEFVSVLAADTNRKYGSMWECPDFFEIDNQRILIVSPENISANQYLHNGKNSVYFTGIYDKEKHVFDYNDGYLLDYGLDFYAPQTTLLKDGRRVLIAWMDNWEANIKPVTQKWSCMMSLPRELSIKNNLIIQKPVSELALYHDNMVCYQNVLINKRCELKHINGRIMDMEIEILNDDYRYFKIVIASGDAHHVDIVYNQNTNMIELDRTYCGMTSDMNCIRRFKLFNSLNKLRMIIDKYSCELFINDGMQVASMTYYTDLSCDKVYFDGDNVKVNIVKFDIKDHVK